MLIVIPYSHNEIERATQLLGWMRELDGQIKHHKLLLISSFMVPQDEAQNMVSKAGEVFTNVSAIRQTIKNEQPWPKAANAMFKTALEWMRAGGQGHWFWCETDVIPVRKQWLDKLDAEYRTKGLPFMGAIYDRPFRHLNGAMLYPQNPGKFNRAMYGANELPFDLIKPEVTLRHAFATRLIVRMLADPSRNLPMTFPDVRSLDVIPPDCVVFHGNKDGTLIERLREQQTGATFKPPVSPNGIGKLTRGIKSLFSHKTTSKTAYYHTGNLGDIIYGLAAIKLHGGGDLFIGPAHSSTAPCSMPVNQDQFNKLLPLLEAQPYIRTARYTTAYPQKLDHDLNRFRNLWFDLDVRLESGVNSLCAMHCYLLGVLELFKEKDPWMTVPKKNHGRIVIARSLRHRQWDFPYGKVLKEFGDQCVFVGTQQEHQIFQIPWGKVQYQPVNNFLELAQLIAGASGFVGNQSFPCSLAIALGVPVWQEVFAAAPDCLFKRKNFMTQRNTLNQFKNVI